METPPSAETPHGDQTVAGAVAHVETAVSELTEWLDHANDRIGQVARLRDVEVEIGQLFMRAQRFVSDAVAGAEARAARIIDEAREEAARIAGGAESRPALTPQAASALNSTIKEFARINAELINELTSLHGSLATEDEASDIERQ